MSDTKKEELETQKEGNKFILFLKDNYIFIIFLILILLFKHFFYAPVYVHGDSMYDTLHDGDVMILDIIGFRAKELKRFDIVVIDTGKELIIKRVIGLPGEEIEYNGDKLYVNGKEVNDTYGQNVTENFKVSVPKNKYFVLGDNRQNSMDSRFFGPFKKEKILGKTKFVIFPFDRFGEKE